MVREAAQSRYAVTNDDMAVHLIEDRRSSVSPWGRGNSKIGAGIYTYSRLPGRQLGTCPGSSPECELICYAKRVIRNQEVWRLWERNTLRDPGELPPLPADARIVRFHIAGDFDSVEYIKAWCKLAGDSPGVTFFGYTRSWRVPELLPHLEKLRALPNVSLWASVDKTTELPPSGWRRAFMSTDERATATEKQGGRTYKTADGASALVCPEETGDKANCESCGYCFRGKAGDLIFLEHIPGTGLTMPGAENP